MIPQFANKEELFKWLQANKSTLIAAKKATIKHADSINAVLFVPDLTEDFAVKQDGDSPSIDLTKPIVAKVVINTTNVYDSHQDVHIPGLWKKSLSEKKKFLHMQEHKMAFDKIISDDAIAYTKKLSFKSLGYDYEGSTEALIFDSTIQPKRNEFMYEQYANGYVKEHSVGMRYIKVYLCVNSEERWWIEEKENWDKYFPMVANKSDAENSGWMWAVTEASVVEGSAVVMGSNSITPTISITEAGKSTSDDNTEPVKSTQTGKKSRFASIGSKN